MKVSYYLFVHLTVYACLPDSCHNSNSIQGCSRNFCRIRQILPAKRNIFSGNFCFVEWHS